MEKNFFLQALLGGDAHVFGSENPQLVYIIFGMYKVCVGGIVSVVRYKT